MLLASGVLGSGCGAPGSPPGSPAPEWRTPDLIVISVDTLRADHLPTYGYPRATGPRIDELAERSMVFDRAYTVAPHTLASHTSLFTGLYPRRHGVLDVGDTLSPSIETLAGLLAARGYQTAAFTNCYFLMPEFRAFRGFGRHDFADDIKSPRSAETTNRAVLSWADRLGDEPFFLFVHYFDVHSDWDRLPYEAPDVYLQRFAADPPEGFRTGNGLVSASRWLLRQNQRGIDFSADELEHIRGLYDAGIAYTDEHLGALLDGLAARDRLEHAIVIVTSDHGEEFGEHGRMLHTQVYEELMRVPLLVSLPEMRDRPGPSCRPREESDAAPAPTAGRSDALVQFVDLLPTVAECLDLQTPVGVQGTSFLTALQGEEGVRPVAYFDTPSGLQRGVLRDGWKLVESTGPGIRRLYNLDDDPHERSDVAAEHPEQVELLAAELVSHYEENKTGLVVGESTPVQDTVRQALEALGYLLETPAE